MKRDLSRNLRVLAILMVVAGVAASCGRKGSLEPSPSATAEGEGQKPAQPAGGGLSGLRAKKPAPVLPSKEPSILDPILQ